MKKLAFLLFACALFLAPRKAHAQSTIEKCQAGHCYGFGAPTDAAANGFIYQDLSQSPPALYCPKNGAWVACGGGSGSQTISGTAPIVSSTTGSTTTVSCPTCQGVLPSGSSLPTGVNDQFFTNTSFPFIPNTSNALTYFPGPLFYDNSQWASFCPDTPYAPCWKPLTSNGFGNLGNGPAGEGDSILFGYNLSSPGTMNPLHLMSAMRGQLETNTAVSGSTCSGDNYFVVGGGSGTPWVYESGINDLRSYGSPVLPDYLNCKRGEWIVGTHGFVAASAGTHGGNWTASTIDFNRPVMSTTTLSDPISYTSGGNTVWVLAAVGTTTYASTMTVTIDGVAQTPVSLASAVSGYVPADPGPSTNGGFVAAFPFYNLGLPPAGGHTISIAMTSGTQPLLLYGVSANDHISQAGGNEVSISRMLNPGVGGVSGYAFWGGSDTLVTSFNNALISEIANMHSLGVDIGYIDIRKEFDCNITALCQADGLHPNQAGAKAYATQLFHQFSTAYRPGTNLSASGAADITSGSIDGANTTIGATTPIGSISVNGVSTFGNSTSFPIHTVFAAGRSYRITDGTTTLGVDANSLIGNGYFNIYNTVAQPIQLGANNRILITLESSGGTYIGSGTAVDPGLNNLGIQGVTVGTIATVAAATTIAPITPLVNLTGTTAIATITVPGNMSTTIGGCVTFFPASTVATTTAGNILAIYSLIGGKTYQGCWNGTKWGFIGSGI